MTSGFSAGSYFCVCSTPLRGREEEGCRIILLVTALRYVQNTVLSPPPPPSTPPPRDLGSRLAVPLEDNSAFNESKKRQPHNPWPQTPFAFYNCIVPLAFLPWKIRVPSHWESQLRQRRATQPSVHAGCFSISIFH